MVHSNEVRFADSKAAFLMLPTVLSSRYNKGLCLPLNKSCTQKEQNKTCESLMRSSRQLSEFFFSARMSCNGVCRFHCSRAVLCNAKLLSTVFPIVYATVLSNEIRLMFCSCFWVYTVASSSSHTTEFFAANRNSSCTHLGLQ